MQARMQPVIQYIPRLLLAPVSPLKNRISHSGILNIFLPVRERGGGLQAKADAGLPISILSTACQPSGKREDRP